MTLALFNGRGSTTDEVTADMSTLVPRVPVAVIVTVKVAEAPEANAGVFHRATELLAD